MRKLQNYLEIILVFLSFTSCIQEDLVNDYVEPEFRIDTENPIPERIGLDNTYQFTASFFNDVGQQTNVPITWTSSNTGVITINSQGLATAVGTGQSVITASVADDNPKNNSKTITKTIATLTVDEIQEGTLAINNARTSPMAIGATYNYNADYVGSGTLEWTSSNPSVASIDSASGLVTAKSAGNTRITVAVNDNGSLLTDTTELSVVATQSKQASLSGSYGLTGTVTFTSSSLEFSEDFGVRSAPGGYFYLSNNPNSISAAVKVGGQVTERTGTWSITLDNININNYTYIIFWCDPFDVYLGGGTFE
ncbi:Ig-like domain-containing protein [Ochrovirga pacifica]|uniref:Ig-like domain-containing protein n=1 Tax=Ochrovirga pacifica TaxID=1042376 RepID=UPI0002557FA5|nr:DM13 domain-containing protein [Ochrovirga pacifica]